MSNPFSGAEFNGEQEFVKKLGDLAQFQKVIFEKPFFEIFKNQYFLKTFTKAFIRVYTHTEFNYLGYKGFFNFKNIFKM